MLQSIDTLQWALGHNLLTECVGVVKSATRPPVIVNTLAKSNTSIQADGCPSYRGKLNYLSVSADLY